MSTVALAVLLPVMVIAGALVRIALGSPVFFRQERAGQHGKAFEILKFRTMTDRRGLDDLPLPDDARVTKFGSFLRRSGLDELPQLWNVLRGEMSLIGPRPLYVRYLAHYTPEQFRRHEVRPGITGLAQINGRTSIDWRQQFALDVLYVDTRSVKVDAHILWQSLLIVLGVRPGLSMSSRDELGTAARPKASTGSPIIRRDTQQQRR